MKILDKIKRPFVRIKEKHMAKRKEKLLIKTADDELVVNSLPAEKDNSGIDIQKIVENMENPENMAEVVINNLPEIMEQDKVKDTLKNLPDEEVVEIVEENTDELHEQAKLEFAIRAIGDNDKKLKTANKNLANLTDIELAKILDDLKLETKQERREKIEEEKIRIISKKIMQHIIEFGTAWHLAELMSTVSDGSKIKILDSCLAVMQDYKKSGKRQISSSAKTDLITDLLNLTSLEDDEKDKLIKKYIKKKMLTQEEETMRKNKIERIRMKQEKAEAERRFGMHRD